MTSVTVSHPDAILHGTIRLPSSKSMSNRALILQHVSDVPFILENISTADDTVIMQQALQQHNGTIHLKNAGTCMRFLTACFAATENTSVTLLCDERMELRPIRELVDALRQLGADVTYINKEGFPPLSIKGKKLNGGTISVSASSSSQYVSALMMIAPLCENGLTIQLTGNITSLPYIEMTARMMKKFGWKVLINREHDFSIEIPGQIQKFEIRNSKSEISNLKSQISNFLVEADWSAASYWYEMAALSNACNILLEGLQLNSLQGDAVIHEYMELFGVVTVEEENGVRLTKEIRNSPDSYRDDIRKKYETENQKSEIPHLKSHILNLTSFPDLAPALAVTAAALNIPVGLTGLQNLVIKESNRLEALQTELTKSGFSVTNTDDELEVRESPKSEIRSTKSEKIHTSQILNLKSHISTYSDHRMAMAFAPLALVFGEVTIEHPEVVEKSYPHFWEDLKLVGFQLK